jgi:hypothetical protein
VKKAFELAFLVSEASDGKNLRVEKSAGMRRGAHGVSRLLVFKEGVHLLRCHDGLEISPKDYRNSTFPTVTHPTLAQPMKRAFVIRLTPDTNPAKGKFQGHVEEVDTGRELKFRSVEEFLAFVQECIADGKDAG